MYDFMWFMCLNDAELHYLNPLCSQVPHYAIIYKTRCWGNIK